MDEPRPLAGQQHVAAGNNRLTQNISLARSLERYHITGIAISGTIGIGLFITAGEIIGLAGSVGTLLCYLFAGFVVTSVMLGLTEMISIRPVPGAIFEFPRIYVDPALGIATGFAYWLAYTISVATLSVQTAMLLKYWNLSLGAGIGVTWVTIAIFNGFFPVHYYGWLEWAFKWLKLILVAGLCGLMIAINIGGSLGHIGGRNWHDGYLFPPGFNYSGWQSSGPWKDSGGTVDIPGSLGRFLGFWSGGTLAVYAFIGVELVAVTAAEAKFPNYDLPKAFGWIYILAIIIYTLSALLVGLNVPYNDPRLLAFNSGSTSLSTRSPFIIAANDAGFAPALPGFINGCFVFAAFTAANTAFYVSTRTLFAMSKISGISWVRNYLGRTTHQKIPLIASIVVILLATLSFLGASEQLSLAILGMFQQISTTSILCVYISLCIAYIRYLQGLRFILDRNGEYYTRRFFRSPGHQPFPAGFGICLCSLLIIFNGWHSIYGMVHHGIGDGPGQVSPSKAATGIIGAYLSPVLFLAIYCFNKIKFETQTTPLHSFGQHYNSNDLALDDMPPQDIGKVRKIVRAVI